MAVGYRCAATLSAWRTTVATGHFGRGTGLIDKDQTLGIQIGLQVEPGAPPGQNVRPLLLAGVRGFF